MFCVASSRDATALDRLAELLVDLAQALNEFASSLDHVTSAMEAARSQARAAGLTVTPTGVDLGSPWTAPPLALRVPDDSSLMAPAHLSAEVSAAREEERNAHAALGAALACAGDESWLASGLEAFGLALPTGADTVDKVVWGYGLASLGAGAAADVHLERLARSHTYRWEAPEVGRKDALARRAASRANLVGKVGGPVGNAVTVGMSAKGQWDADRDNDALSDADRWGRAGVRGAVEGGGAIGGAWAGGSAGAAIGTFICPGVGTVVGGAVGSAVGGFAGSQAGKWVAGSAVEAVDDVVDVASDAGAAIGDGVGAATDAVGDGIAAVGDGLDDAGDKLKGAGDKLVFWR